MVAPGVAKVEPTAGQDLGAGLHEGGAGGLLVVDHEPEMTGIVGRLCAALREGDELVPDVDECHSAHPAPQLDLEDLPVEVQRLVEVVHLEGDVVEADQPRFGHVFTLGSGFTLWPTHRLRRLHRRVDTPGATMP